MPVSFRDRVAVPEDVLVTEINGEAVLLNLTSEGYFGLDQVGTRIWEALTSQPSVQDAYAVLLAEYDVSPEQLKEDLHSLLEKLVEHGLLQVLPG